MTIENLLEVKNLKTGFDTDAGLVTAVDGVSFSVKKGKTLGIVGESGCGKSVTSLSIMRLLPLPAARYLGGEIFFKGENLLALKTKEMHRIRGNNISMIFQEPMTALNPVHKIGKQLGEVFKLHHKSMTKEDIRKESQNILEKVGIPEASIRLDEYPHQLSGGMRQRVMIAIALACKPDVLIADEPTTALDVTIQAQILRLMANLQKDTEMGMVFITHDLGVIAEICDEVLVMYAGRVVESGPVYEIFENPKHPYTKGLLSSIPRLESKRKETLNTISGTVPSIFNFPEGCRFINRCKFSTDQCVAKPNIEKVDGKDDHEVACFHWREF